MIGFFAAKLMILPDMEVELGYRRRCSPQKILSLLKNNRRCEILCRPRHTWRRKGRGPCRSKAFCDRETAWLAGTNSAKITIMWNIYVLIYNLRGVFDFVFVSTQPPNRKRVFKMDIYLSIPIVLMPWWRWKCLEIPWEGPVCARPLR